MNRFAYRTTGLAIKALASLTRANVCIHGADRIPDGPTIFVVNHFTRIETFLLPYTLHRLCRKPVWSLAASELFVGKFGRYLEQVGAVSTHSPHRDRLMVKSLLTDEACWIIFPEGRMVKSKQIVEKGRFMISYAGGKHPPHTGAATLALRTEFYRQRLMEMGRRSPREARRVLGMFTLSGLDALSRRPTRIVPVNLTYYPLRSRENVLSRLAERVVEDLPERIAEEIMTEGAMLLSGVDIDMRFGQPIEIRDHLTRRAIRRDIQSTAAIDFDDAIPSRRMMRREALGIMQAYMAAIYRMTTVNHDHLFAACLKKAPVSRIDAANIRRRVFLASQIDPEKLGIHFHRNLNKDQVHLLSDDRHNRFSEFIDFAVDKQVLEQHGSVLRKNAGRLAHIFDFHRSRVDNPVAVMANEIEPLTRLQRRISRLCWHPGCWLRRNVSRFLINAARKTFEHDYASYSHLGVSKPRKIGQPFLIRGDRRRVGIVLAHGYMAAPAEVRGLADYLGRLGFWVYAPRLKGHGTAPEDLAACSYRDWIESMDTGFAILSNLCRRVIAGGFSTGAGLALDLAQRVPDVAGVFAVSTPLRLQDMAARFVPAVDVWNRIMERLRLDDAKKTFVDNHPENPHINYLKNPIAGVRELERLMSSLEPRLPDIHVPALVVQSQGDPVVNPKGTETLFSQLGTADKQLVMFNFKRHGILLGDGCERVYRTIGNFVKYIRENDRAGAPVVENHADSVVGGEA